MNTLKPFLLPPSLLLAAALLAACAGTPDRHYTLSPPPQAEAAAPAGAPSFAIEFAPVAVPERLARPQMVVRRGAEAGAEVQVLEQHRWAASFEQELRDALATGVARQLGATDVTRGGRAPGQTVWRIAVQVQDFDAVAGQAVSTRLQWRLRRPDTTDAGGCTWSATEPVGESMEAVAAGAQRLTARAAQAMAAYLKLAQGGAGPACQSISSLSSS